MAPDMKASQEEIRYLRDLAKQQKEYASLPIMAERTRLWFEHNALLGKSPMVVMEMGSFWDSVMPKPRCESPAARQIENQLRENLVNHEAIDDDKVVPSYFRVNWGINFLLFDLNVETTHAKDETGN
jgi:hypothetical protein